MNGRYRDPSAGSGGRAAPLRKPSPNPADRIQTTCQRMKALVNTLKRASGRWSAGQKGSPDRCMAPDSVCRRFAPPQGGDRWRHRHSRRGEMLGKKIAGQAPCRDAHGYARFGLSTRGCLGLRSPGLGVALATRMLAWRLRCHRNRLRRRRGPGVRALAAVCSAMVVRESRHDSAQQVARQAERSDPATRRIERPHDQITRG